MISLKSLFTRSLFFATGLAMVGGCNVYDETLISTGPQCASGEVGCKPQRPAASTSSPDDSTDMTFALRDVVISQYNRDLGLGDQAQPWRSIGFDLDGLKTNTRTDRVACTNQWRPELGGEEPFPIDGVNGIDNVFGGALSAGFVLPTYPMLQNDLCCNQTIGRGTLILRIRSWNGEDDDATVRVSLMIAKDATSLSDDMVEWNTSPGVHELRLKSDVGMAAPAPSWVADADTFYIGTNDVSGEDVNMPKHEDTNAFVRDGNIVMSLNPLQPVKLYLGSQNGISIGLQGGVLVARLSADRRFIVSGTMGGRMGQAELKDASQRTLGSSATQDECDDIVAAIGPLIDAYGDLLSDGSVNADAPCDAVSAGVRFRGVRSRAPRVAAGTVCIPYPMCDGITSGACDATADDAVCPWQGGVCNASPWTGPTE